MSRQLRRQAPAAAGVLLALGLLLLLAFTRGGAARPERAWQELTPAPLAPIDLSGYPWLYLRDGRSLAPDEAVATVAIVGDVMAGRGVPVGQGVPADASPWTEVAGWLSPADVTLGNLEAVLTDRSEARTAPPGESQPILLRAEPSTAIALRQAGFDILGLANNHALDYGPAGLSDAVDTLHAAGLEPFGVIGADGVQPPLLREVNGVRLAFLAFNAVPDPHPDRICAAGAPCWPRPAAWEPAAAAEAIVAARARADAVIVSIHWGYEYEAQPDPYQESIAQGLLAAGADLVAGHHAHVAQPVAITGNQAVAYGLGNFLFDQGEGDTGWGLALRALFDREGLRALQALPVRAGPRPRLATPAEADSFLERLQPAPRRLAFTCAGDSCHPAEEPAVGQTGLFYAGQIDLTGDGRAETVRREGAQIVIYDRGELVWRSPSDWRIVDASLGDPNDDGRYEIMLALWRKDGAGYERSQPYIVGYRGGEYALLWGGRPVADPIRELAVGDVDGDGVDELVVIEELAAAGDQAVSVWRWTGWTFSLVWRSDGGRYRDLVLDDDAAGQFSVALSGG